MHSFSLLTLAVATILPFVSAAPLQNDAIAVAGAKARHVQAGAAGTAIGVETRATTVIGAAAILTELSVNLGEPLCDLHHFTAKNATAANITPILKTVVKVVGDAAVNLKGLKGKPHATIYASVDGTATVGVDVIAKLLATILGSLCLALKAVLSVGTPKIVVGVVGDVALGDCLCGLINAVIAIVDGLLAALAPLIKDLASVLVSLSLNAVATVTNTTMDQAGEASHSQSPTSFVFGDASTRWVYDAAEEMDADADMDHVVWQASQPNCAALNQLMSDANKRRSPHRTRIKCWTPSPGSTLSDVSSASISPLTASSLPPLSRSAARLESDPGALLELIKGVSAKVDESALLKRQAIERARLKARAKRDKEKGHPLQKIGHEHGVFKKRIVTLPCSIDSRGNERQYTKVGGDLITRQESVATMNTDEDTQRMPPPTMLPAHRSWSSVMNTAPSPPSTFQSHGQNYTESASVHAALVPDHGALIDLQNHERAHGPHSLSRHISEDHATVDRASTSPPVVTILHKSSSSSEKGRPPNGMYNTKTFTNSPPGNIKSRESMNSRSSTNTTLANSTLPQASQIRAQNGSKPKSSPVLGMRRPGSSQQPSSSQGFKSANTSLPLKQKQFRTPFAKTSPPAQQMPVANQVSPMAAPRSSSLSAIRGRSPTAVSTTIPTRSVNGSTPVDTNPTFILKFDRPRVESPRDSHRQKQEQYTGVVDDDCSSPLPEADVSFNSIDFDMGIDAEELEKACSMYD
ncbi:hypothetical protein EW145_g6681 [Phellinidium pouzarii]|uniref:Uncharacterized protein n=1 Tax=Phellinidium pouzarii TaxID=167371 RepID=A0A4V3XBQ5_9AGAM|nr:hypothetical protein EW145_g6681 [Phellinidium pouzarii]